jgi:S1-C subfamily serine protease
MDVMLRRFSIRGSWFLHPLCALSALVQLASPPVFSVPASAPQGTQYRVVRSVSGAKGREVNGRFIMEDPKSVFTSGQDAKVIVYFEWEGPVGPHHFEGLWRSPEGKIVLISDFRYEAKIRQFSGYWTMLLSETVPSGEWTLEARIDGEYAGKQSFVITSSPNAAPPTPTRRMPTTAELYQQAVAASVIIEKIGTDGSVIGRGSGFWIGEGRVLTAFETLDGAASVRVILQDRSQRPATRLLSWNRWQNWAILAIPATSGPSLKRATDPAAVGDHCVFLEVTPGGSRFTDGTITGKTAPPRAGERFLLQSSATSASTGGALLNESGEWVGVISGTAIPGANSTQTFGLQSEPSMKTDSGMYILASTAIPASLISDTPAQAATTALADLADRGEFVRPVVDSHLIGFATLTNPRQKEDKAVYPPVYKKVFSHRDGRAGVYVHWQSQTRTKGSVLMRVFNLDNKIVVDSKPSMISIGPENTSSTSWEIPLANLSPGIYRVDVILGEDTIWRDFFRVTD